MTGNDIAATDPFSAEAIDATREKCISTAAERQAAQAHSKALAERGYVIIESLLDTDQLAAVRKALDAINAGTRLGIYEFEGNHTHRAYNVVSRSRAFDPLIADTRVLAEIGRAHV